MPMVTPSDTDSPAWSGPTCAAFVVHLTGRVGPDLLRDFRVPEQYVQAFEHAIGTLLTELLIVRLAAA